MFTENMLAELNKQHNYELYSAYLYMAMEAYFHEKGLSGFANFFKVQTEEERAHARIFYEFIIRKGGSVTLDAIERPEADFESPSVYSRKPWRMRSSSHRGSTPLSTLPLATKTTQQTASCSGLWTSRWKRKKASKA